MSQNFQNPATDLVDYNNLDANNEPAEKKISYKKIISVFLSGWYYILGALLIALAVAFFFIRSAERIYSTSSVIRISSDKSDFSLEASPIQLYRPRVDLESETFVIKSREVMENAVKRINYQISYFVKGRVRNTNVYPETPFNVVVQDSVTAPSGLFEVEPKTSNTFNLIYNEKSETYGYGQLITVDGFRIKIFKGVKPLNDPFLFRINTPQSVMASILPVLQINPYSRNSNIISLSVTFANPYYASDLLNAILDEYIAYSASSKQRAASQTIDFINDQLGLLSAKVKQSESALENYKRSNSIIDLGTNTTMISNNLSDMESQKMQLKLQSLTIDQLEEQIRQSREKININLGLDIEASPGLSGILSQFNSLITERNKLLIQYNEKSVNVTQVDAQIQAIRDAATNSIRLLRQKNTKTMQFVEQQIASLKGSLYAMPSAERELFSLTTNNEINQKVYTFLNEKKLSAQISRASTVSDASIVERAAPNLNPISPVPADIYKKFIVLGLVVGFGIIMLLRLMYPYISDRAYVEAHTTIPILGIIRKFPERIDDANTQVLASNSPKSVFAESVRSVRTNLSFFASHKSNKVICITSELAGEGKSFTSLNLSATLSLIEKKVVLVAADLRRSKLHKTFDTQNKKGLSSYLSGQATLDDIIIKTGLENLNFIASGAIPPNPSELLHSQRMEELISALSAQFDYVIIDTAPVGLISDAIPLLRNADLNIFVIRSGVSKHTAVTLPGKIANELKLNNVSIILNEFEHRPLFSSFYSTDFAETGYYGYYYYTDYSAYSSYLDIEKKPWWKKVFGN